MERANALRRGQTDAEAKLWSRLRASQTGAKFRRQHPLNGYITDFCCIEHRLIVELDGGQHPEQRGYDGHRTQALEALGFRRLRFWNNDALTKTDDVMNAIVRALNQPPPPHPGPLPQYSRGRGGKSRSRSNRAETKTPSPATHSSLQARDTTPSPPTRLSLQAGDTTPSPPTCFSSGERVGVRGQGSKAENQHDPSDRSRRIERALLLRARLYALIREFFAQRGVTEVETPILSTAGNTEPNIEGFSTTFTGPIGAGARERFLRTSPEYPLKRLLAAGFGDCYELGRVFRNGEAGRSHNPEFTMLEWYRVGFDHRRLALEAAQLTRAALALVQRDASVATTSYRNWFRDGLGRDPFAADEAALRAPLADFHIDPDGLERDDWLDLLITHCLQPGMPNNAITIVYDFPASQCSLARIGTGSPPIAERFELYLGQHELANGYHELNHAAEQRARFEHDNVRRVARGQRELPLDENLLAVLDALPDCAGVALGVDRLLMTMLGADDLRDVLAFPFVEA